MPLILFSLGAIMIHGNFWTGLGYTDLVLAVLWGLANLLASSE